MKSETTMDSLKTKSEPGPEGMEVILGGVTEQAAKYAQSAQEAIKSARPLLEKSIKEQPMQTLAAIAAVGFLLGAMWKK